MRTRAEIDREYTVIAQLYGDRVFKGAKLQDEIKALHDKMTQLSQEQAAPEALKKNEPSPAQDGGSDSAA